MSLCIHAQTSVSAGIKPTAGVSNGVSIFLKSSIDLSGKVSGVTVALAVPTSVGIKPIVTIDNSPNTSVIYTLQNTVDQTIEGDSYYVYNLLGTGDQSAAAVIYSMTANTEIEIVKATFGGNMMSSQIRLVSLPNGGTDANANSLFGFSLSGTDRANESALFYTVPGISTARNEIIAGGYSGLSITTTTNNVVLPVKFTSFTANKKDNNALLNWTVANETASVDRYEIERSLDGSTFKKINSFLKSNGTNNTNTYNYIDANISEAKGNGTIYYRIKQVDIDGRFVYSEIKNIKSSQGNWSMTVFPNPVKTNAILQVDVPASSQLHYSIVSSSGKSIQNNTMQVNKGINTETISMNNFASGTYLLTVMIGETSKTIKIIKE